MPAESPGLPIWTPGVWGVVWEVGVWESGTPPIPPAITPAGGIIVGVVTVLGEDVVYSLPPVFVMVMVTTTAGTIEISLNGTTWQAVTLDANDSFLTSAVFIRSIDDDSEVIAKKAF